jgi:hypothetical protein
MPHCGFYAIPDDWLRIVEFIFSNDAWVLYETYSLPDREIRTFRSIDQVRALILPEEESYDFCLHSPAIGGSVQFRRIVFSPGAVSAATHRYRAEGWGLINLHVHAPKDGHLRPCNTNHFSARGAAKWEPIRTDVSTPVDAWDWKQVTSISNRLNRYIRSLGVAKRGSRPVLAGAQAALDSGEITFLG